MAKRPIGAAAGAVVCVTWGHGPTGGGPVGGRPLSRPARVIGFDFPFCVPHALLSDEKFTAAVGFEEGAFLGWRTFNW